MNTPAAPAPMRGLFPIAGAVTACTAASGMALYARHHIPVVLDSHGETALLGGVLLVAAVLGMLLCAYLALICALASSVLLLGPASRAGTALLGALRILAPQLARRLTLGAACATAATGLVLAPATAADPSPERGAGQIAVAATLNSASPLPADGPGSPPSDGDPISDPAEPQPGGAGTDQADDDPSASQDASSRPGLGWSEAAPADTPTAPLHPSDNEARTVPEASSPSSPAIVEVLPGDSLWSITDDLLGPGPDALDDISSLWPVLHDVNSDVIGPNPHQIEPGQVLTVPAELTSQEHS